MSDMPVYPWWKGGIPAGLRRALSSQRYPALATEVDGSEQANQDRCLEQKVKKSTIRIRHRLSSVEGGVLSAVEHCSGHGGRGDLLKAMDVLSEVRADKSLL